jgi:mersacidin/lichenicidin family type 2 lantibiotic
MSNFDVIRAWKDQEYRLGLSEAQLAILPEHPSGLIELENPLNVSSGTQVQVPFTQAATCFLCVPTWGGSCDDFCLPHLDGQAWAN